MTISGDHQTNRSIVVDGDVFRELQRRAEPLVDDANSVLRRIFGLEATSATVWPRDTSDTSAASVPSSIVVSSAAPPETKQRPKRGTYKGEERKRAPKGSLLPEVEYELPMLRSLEELGGSGPASSVVDLVGDKLDEKLTLLDREPVSSGEVRWRNRVQFVRLGLIKGGFMKADSPRGVWEISDAGLARLEETVGADL